MSPKSKSGFTLLEILLVVGIIAILAGIVIIAINPSKQLASVRNTQRLSDLKQLNNAMTQFYIDHSYYAGSTTLSTTSLKEICNTGSGSATTTTVNGTACDSTLVNLSELVPVYITAIPTDPVGTSSLLTFIPAAYAASNGTGYKIMRTVSNQIVEQAPMAELGNQVAIGTVPWIPISGLLAHWKMNDNAANMTVLDTMGSYTGTTNFNTSANTVAGVVGSALSFNGSGNYIKGLPGFGRDDHYTYSLWFKANSFNDNAGLFDLEYYKDNSHFVAFKDYLDSSGNLYCWAYSYNGSRQDINCGSAAITTGKWYNFVMVWNGGSSPVVTSYLNGQLLGSDSHALGFTWTASQMSNSNTDIIGRACGYSWFSCGSWVGYLNGSIDDVRVYNRALSTSEISQIYNNGNGTEAE